MASIRKADLDKLARVTEQFLQQYLAANEALRDAERWDVGGQPFVAVLARRKNKRAGGGEDDGCARPSSSPAMSLRVCEREHNTQHVRSSIPAPKTSEFFFVEIHKVGPNKDTTVIAEMKAPADKALWLECDSPGELRCVGILPPQNNPDFMRRSLRLLDQLLRGLSPEERDELKAPVGWFTGPRHATRRQRKAWDEMVGAWKPNETEGKQRSAHQGVQRLITEVTSVVRRYANPSRKPFQNKPVRHFGFRRNGKHGMQHSSRQQTVERGDASREGGQVTIPGARSLGRRRSSHASAAGSESDEDFDMSSGSSSDDDTELVSDGLRGETLEVNSEHWVVPDQKLAGAQGQHVRVYYGGHTEAEKVRSAENTLSLLQGAHEQECQAAPAAVEQNQLMEAAKAWRAQMAIFWAMRIVRYQMTLSTYRAMISEQHAVGLNKLLSHRLQPT